MIQPNAKCVVNGKKVNEIALWVNEFLKLNNEELDVVDVNNTPAKRWFLTGAIAGAPTAAESGDRDNLGGTSGGAAGSTGGASGNRDKLNPAPAGGNAGGPVGGGDAGQGGNVNPAVNVDGGGGGGAAAGGGGGAAGGAGRVRTPAGSATAIGGRRAQPADADVAPETLPATEPTPAPEPVSEPTPAPGPAPEPVSEPAPEPVSEPAPEPETAETNPIDAIYRKLNNNKTRMKHIQAEIDHIEMLIRTPKIPYSQVPAAKKTIQRLKGAKAAIQKENNSLTKELMRVRQERSAD